MSNLYELRGLGYNPSVPYNAANKVLKPSNKIARDLPNGHFMIGNPFAPSYQSKDKEALGGVCSDGCTGEVVEFAPFTMWKTWIPARHATTQVGITVLPKGVQYVPCDGTCPTQATITIPDATGACGGACNPAGMKISIVSAEVDLAGYNGSNLEALIEAAEVEVVKSGIKADEEFFEIVDFEHKLTMTTARVIGIHFDAAPTDSEASICCYPGLIDAVVDAKSFDSAIQSS